MSPESPERMRFLVLTPALDGAYGIAELSRQAIRTLVRDASAERGEVWALDAGAGGSAPMVGRMPRHERYKGHDWLIDVWPFVVPSVPDARLVVVGRGDDRARLEARVAAAGVGGAIRFAGRVSDEELAGLYRACAFFVMPSANEGFGLAYLEAMRAGKP